MKRKIMEDSTIKEFGRRTILEAGGFMNKEFKADWNLELTPKLEGETLEITENICGKITKTIMNFREEATFAALIKAGWTPPEGNWQPIETAPKTGEQFLVTDGEYVIIAEWGNYPDAIDLHDCTSCGMAGDSKPTKWRPLPSPE